MKLNPDCMRDILFYLEEHLSISEELEFEEISMYALAQILMSIGLRTTAISLLRQSVPNQFGQK